MACGLAGAVVNAIRSEVTARREIEADSHARFRVEPRRRSEQPPRILRKPVLLRPRCAPVGTVWRAVQNGRSLSLVHTHTGERLSTVYFEGGQYMASRAQSNQTGCLRDFRTGDVHPIDPAVLDIPPDLRTLADRDEPYEVISGYRSPKTKRRIASTLERRGRA